MEWIADPSIWVGLATLVVLEIVLGVDNLIFIAILVGRLPEHQRERARILGLSLALALFPQAFAPYDPLAFDLQAIQQGPSLAHPFGTDNFGRDILSMIMVGARNSISVSIVAVLVGAGIGVPLGAWAAARGGWVDGLVMRMSDLAFAFPALLTAVIITAIFGPGAVNAMIAIGIFNIPVFARVTRGASMGLWKREYVQAARCAGRASCSA